LRFTTDVDEVLNLHWRSERVLSEVSRRLIAGNYDFVLTLFPSAETHGAHKAATLTVLTAVENLSGPRPVVLSCQESSVKDASPLDWSGFKSNQHPFSVEPQKYSVDRTVQLGYNNALTYQIVANWVIAAHKSQGALQMDMGRFDKEEFTILETNTPSSGARADQLFHQLSESPSADSSTLAFPANLRHNKSLP
jgi:N-acetylglucosamine malate deacetylase 2